MKGNRHESQMKAIEKKHQEAQAQRILEFLLTGCPITTKQCRIFFKSDRAAARIAELRKQGFPISTRLVEVEDGKRVAEYSL